MTRKGFFGSLLGLVLAPLGLRQADRKLTVGPKWRDPEHILRPPARSEWQKDTLTPMGPLTVLRIAEAGRPEDALVRMCALSGLAVAMFDVLWFPDAGVQCMVDSVHRVDIAPDGAVYTTATVRWLNGGRVLPERGDVAYNIGSAEGVT